MKKQLSLEEAKRLSLIKWKLIVKNDGNEPDDYPSEIENISNHFGFCERWHDSKFICGHNYEKCEFYAAQGNISCFSLGKNLFSDWCTEEDNSPKKLTLTKKILKLIKSIPVKKQQPKKQKP